VIDASAEPDGTRSAGAATRSIRYEDPVERAVVGRSEPSRVSTADTGPRHSRLPEVGRAELEHLGDALHTEDEAARTGETGEDRRRPARATPDVEDA
jgi:hypothetical protein